MQSNRSAREGKSKRLFSFQCSGSEEKVEGKRRNVYEDKLLRGCYEAVEIHLMHVSIDVSVYLCVGVLLACMSEQHMYAAPIDARRGCQSPWDCRYR